MERLPEEEVVTMKEKSNKEFKLIFTKDLFIETINAIGKQQFHDKKCSKAFGIILDSDFVTCYNNSYLLNPLTKILKKAMDDKDDWIGYFLWELDFGRKWKKNSVEIDGKNIKLQNASDLWELLIRYNNK